MHEIIKICRCEENKRIEHREQYKKKDLFKKKKLKDSDLFEMKKKKINNIKYDRKRKKGKGRKKR